MFVSNHALAGLVIGRRAPRPTLAFCAGLGSHFVMDAILHWGPRSDSALMTVAVRDGVVATWALLVTTSGQASRCEVAGVLGAVLPDLRFPAKEMLALRLFPRWFDVLHDGVQWERPGLLASEGAAFAILLAAAAGRKQRIRPAFAGMGGACCEGVRHRWGQMSSAPWRWRRILAVPSVMGPRGRRLW